MNSFGIRRATPDDARGLAAVHFETVLFAYAEIFPPDAQVPTEESLVQEWQRAFADTSLLALLAEDRNGPVGGVAIRADPSSASIGELRRLHVLPDRWGSGLGTALHDVALDTLRIRFDHAGLWVLAENLRARRFYERRGWVLLEGEKWPASQVLEVRYKLALR